MESNECSFHSPQENKIFISMYFELLKAKSNDTKSLVILDDPISSFDSIYKNKIIYAILNTFSVLKKHVLILTHNIDTIRLMEHQYKNSFNLYYSIIVNRQTMVLCV